jgi:hypothetical protein
MADATSWQPVWALLAGNASAIAKQSLAYLEAWIQLDPLVSAVHVRVSNHVEGALAPSQ